MGKSTISMAIFHSFLYVCQRVIQTRLFQPIMGKSAMSGAETGQFTSIGYPTYHTKVPLVLGTTHGKEPLWIM